MKTFYFILFIFLFSCSKSETETIATVIDTHIDLKIINNNGEDLLDPNQINTLNTNDIWIKHLNNGVVENYFCHLCDLSKGFYFYNRDNFNVMSLVPNIKTQLDNSNPITYIEWNENDTDTIQCYILNKKSKSFIICTKVWYNGKLVWNNDSERFITIVKN